MKKSIDLLLAGTGGQGIILASNLLGEVAMESGYDVKKSDVLGMAQRGGAVVSHVRLGDNVRSPLAQKGKVDVILSLEMLEAARWVEYLRPEGYAVVNEQCVLPVSVTSGYATYPSRGQIEELLKARTSRFYYVDALAIALDLGNRNVINLVLMGFLSHLLPIDADRWEKGISQRVPSKFRELNLEAFRQGRTVAMRIVGSNIDKLG